jgi:peroxiredoxin
MTASYGVDLSDSGRATRRSVLVGPTGKVAKVYDTVKPADHPDEVLADLAALG